MQTLDLIFVTSGRHPVTEKLICETTNSIYAHAAVGLVIDGEYRIIEAVRPCVRVAPGDAFDDAPVRQVISLPITEEQRQAVVRKVLTVIGSPYGIDDCIISGAHDLFGDQAADVLDSLLGSDHSIQCSGLAVELAREAYPDFGGEQPANWFTPERARVAAIEFANRLGVAV